MTASPPPKSPAGKVALLIVGLMVLLTALYAAADKMAPYSGKGSVAANTVLMASRVAGQITEVHVQDNQQVSAGDILFQIDPEPLELEIRRAEANVAQALQTIEAHRAALVASEARVASARATLENTRRAAERSSSLAGRGIQSKAEADRAALDLVSADNALSVAEADLESARVSAALEANPQLAAAEVQLEQARLNRRFATVTAPTNGYVTNLRLAVGQYVGVGTSALTFIQSDNPWITADFRENQLSRMKEGDPVTLVFDGDSAKVYSGKVESIALGIDTGRTSANGLTQNVSQTRWFEPARTIPVRIKLDDDDQPHNVRVGSKVSVAVYTAGRSNPVAWLVTGLHHLQSYISVLY